MKSNHDLYELIESLGKTEKGYFKKYAYKGEKKDSIYLKLFQDIDKQIGKFNYDEIEEKLKKKYQAQKPYTSLKNYLYKLLVNVMVDYDKSNSNQHQVLELIHSGQYFRKKGLHKQAAKQFEKALKKSRDLELFNFTETILEELCTLYQNQHQFLPVGKTVEEYIEQLNANQQNIQQINLLRSSFHKLIEHYKKHGFFTNVDDKEVMLKLFIDDLKPIATMEASVRAKVIHLEGRSLILFVRREMLKSRETQISIVKLKENHLDLTDDPYRYLFKHYFQISQDSFTLNDYKTGEENLRKLNLIRPMNEKDVPFHETIIRYLRIKLHFMLNEFEKTIPYLENHLDYFKKTEFKKLSIYDSIVITNGIHVSFILENYTKCIDWINIYMEHIKGRYFEETISPIYVTNIMAHFELKNEELLPYLIRNAYRQISKKGALMASEKAIFDFIRKRSRLVNKNEILDLYKATYKIFVKILEDPKEELYIDYIDIRAWLQSKIENRSYKEVYSQYNGPSTASGNK